MGIDEEFDRFVKASFVGLCRTGYLICGDRQRAEDAAQEALLRAHRHWRRVSDPLAYLTACHDLLKPGRLVSSSPALSSSPRL